MIHNTHKGLMGMKRTHASDAWRVAAFLALSGGGRRAWLRAERYLAIIALFRCGLVDFEQWPREYCINSKNYVPPLDKS